MPLLVAVDLPGGPAFVEALRRVWDAGDVAFPLDRRLPGPARARLLEALQPDLLLDADGVHAARDVLGPAARGHLAIGALADGDALVVATSGSTGEPKGVVLTHAAVTASALATSARLGAGAADTWLACLPLSHVGGLSVVTRALAVGAGLVVHDGFDATEVERAARDGATCVSLVATALRRIDPAAFRVILLGGSTPPEDRPANAVTTYGLTETGSGVVYDGVPIDGVEVRVAGDGEVQLRGPMLMRTYRATTAIAHPVDAAGWLSTGDLGSILPDGRLQVDGRRGDLIVTGGENVWPEPVEAALRAHPAVTDAAVAGVDDEEWGRRVVAWIVPRDPSRPPTLAELRGHVCSTMPKFAAPRELRLVGAIPRTGVGKVARHRLPEAPPG